MNWRNVRLTCAWLLFALGCGPAIFIIAFIAAMCLAAVICSAILFAIAIVCILPGMLIAPNRTLNFVYKKEDINVKATWDLGNLIGRRVDND